MSGPGPSFRDGLFDRPSLRWPFRFFVAAVIAAGIGFAFLSSEARPWLLGVLAATGGFLAWSVWDETRGRAAALTSARARWLEAGDVVDNGDDLHFSEDGQPLIARLWSTRAGAGVTILTPLRETTAAFRIASATLPRPSFDGLEPPVGGPPLQRLPGLQTLVADGLVVEGNDPATLSRWLDQPLVDALAAVARDHAATFRGLTFDGRFLAVHWLGPMVAEPETARALSAALWRTFVPRLPPTRSELLN